MKTETLIILTPGFAKNEKDSTCLPAQQSLIKAFNKEFPSLKIIILSFQYPFIKAYYEWHNNRVIAFNGRNKGKFSRLILWQMVWKTLKQIYAGHNVIGVLSFWCGECALIGKRFGNKYDIKHYCWILGQDAKKENKYVRWIRPHAEELVALSNFVKDEFFKNHAVQPEHLIPIGIDPDEFSRETPERDIDLLGAGSIIPLKKYDVFIAIAAALKKNIPGLRAAICGKGPEEINLNSLIKKSGLENNILLTGEKPHSEVLSLMQRSKVFLHTSAYEGFGVVCIEALYAGAHVISFCQPMNQPIKNWHIVNSSEEMIGKALEILQTAKKVYEPVMPYSIVDTAKATMKLFGYNEMATS